MTRAPSLSVERYISSIARLYMNAAIVMTLLIGAGYVTVKVALDRHALQQSVSFATSSQFISFQQLANQTRALMRASGDRDLPDSLLQPMIKEIRRNIAHIRALGGELRQLNQALGDNALERLRPRDTEYERLREELNERLEDFLSRAERVTGTSSKERRLRYSFWGPIDFATSSDGALMQQFGDLISRVHDRSDISINNAATLYTLLALLLEATLLFASFFLFKPLLKKLKQEHGQSKEYEAQLAHQAHTDALTGLNNRAAFHEELEETLALLPANGGGFSLLLLDLDRFKDINDSYGHPAGDAVLCHVAKAIRGAVRAQDVAARLGGDEFAILVHGITDPVVLQGIAARILEGIRADVSVDGHLVHVSASIGGAIAPVHAASKQDLIRIADIALYASKGLRGKAVIFDEASWAERMKQNQLMLELVTAPERGEFVVHYQPKVDLVSGTPLGFEAVVRWQHPQRGLLPPIQFLPLVEGAGVMRQMTRAVIDATCKDIRKWKDARIAPGPVSINLPESLLVCDDGFQMFADAIQANGICWSDLTVEVTENVFFDQGSDRIYRSADRFREHGASVSLDDFGTGFASLLHLRDFPFDEMKIDRSFVSGIGHDPRSEQITRSMLDLSRSLGKNCVAEGVETEVQRTFLAAHGCSVAQGYLFAKPMPVNEATSYLETFITRVPLRREARR
ncbi:diguanylate cyclase (GGDEF)-like protein [Ciceribacter lividus]|uniref:Diguanylate cyclase (GGDEF)-like protein n=1 Tax=Ciceribacter lividus TaxID=1197950 RepID=A0A6I7HSW1_9HYPH|nr:EAL domain-containing protein [Ciceribacter lividus]RCW28072.1 diguanylate cyclase (GGDEF)-like protein [Ciceribacter lividus]